MKTQIRRNPNLVFCKILIVRVYHGTIQLALALITYDFAEAIWFSACMSSNENSCFFLRWLLNVSLREFWRASTEAAHEKRNLQDSRCVPSCRMYDR